MPTQPMESYSDEMDDLDSEGLRGQTLMRRWFEKKVQYEKRANAIKALAEEMNEIRRELSDDWEITVPAVGSALVVPPPLKAEQRRPISSGASLAIPLGEAPVVPTTARAAMRQRLPVSEAYGPPLAEDTVFNVNEGESAADPVEDPQVPTQWNPIVQMPVATTTAFDPVAASLGQNLIGDNPQDFLRSVAGRFQAITEPFR